LNLTPFEAPALAAHADDRWYDLLDLQNLKFTLGFRHTGRHRTNFRVNTKTEAYAAGLGHTLGAWNIGGNFGWTLVDNDVAAQNDNRSENWGVTLSRALPWKPLGIEMNVNAGYKEGYDGPRNRTRLALAQGPNAGLNLARGPLTASFSWSLNRRINISNNFRRSSSRTHAGNGTISYRPPRFEKLSLNLTASLNDTNEDIATQNFRTRDVRFDVGYDF
jgi:predicted porin